MARTIMNPILSFLSTAVFFATFALVGDVLIAATFAVATAIIQFFVRQSAFRSKSALIWASLALVLALTGLTLKGDDAFAATLSQAQMSRQVSAHVSPCGCRMPASSTEAKLSASPLL